MAENTRRILDQQEATSLSGDDFLVADNANLGTRKISYERLLSGVTPLPPNYLTGFVITKTGNTTFSVSSGYARSMDNVRNIVLNNVINKNLSSFVMGDGGSMPDSLSAQQNKVYYVFAIANAGGLVDIIVDTDINCDNGLFDATVQANNFNKWTRIGEIRTRSNAIEIVSSISYSIDFHDLNIRNLNIIAQDNNKEGGEIEFVSAPNEVNAGKRMFIDRYEGRIRIVAVSSNNTTRELLNADAEIGDVQGNIGRTGIIYPFGGSTVPEGFLPCNGAAVSRTKYSRLFAAIGTIWGAGDGSTTFNVPNFIERTFWGAISNIGSYDKGFVPNITGYIGLHKAGENIINKTGVFSESYTRSLTYAGHSGTTEEAELWLHFNANESSDRYVNNFDYIRPSSCNVMFIIKY